MRGTFANIRLKNQLAPGTEGGWTTLLPDHEVTTIYDASVAYRGRGVPLLVIAGKEYGSGSSRDWAAKGTLLLGVRAVIAESYERIHRSNLVNMGVLPLQFRDAETAVTLKLTGHETFDVLGTGAELTPGGTSRYGPRPRRARFASLRRSRASTRPRNSSPSATVESCRTWYVSSSRAESGKGVGMTPMRIAGILLIVAGLAGMIWGGFSWTDEKTVVEIGPFQATAKERKTIPIPPVVGGIAFVAGVVLLVVPGRRTQHSIERARSRIFPRGEAPRDRGAAGLRVGTYNADMAMPEPSASDVKDLAAACGFDLCGIAPVENFEELQFLREWIARGYHGEMHYMERTAARRSDVRAVLPSARSVIVLGTLYNSPRPYSTTQVDPAQTAIARYAWGDDYHDVIGSRMTKLVESVREIAGPFEYRAYVDTGPIQERVYAQYAGLGWIGKNTCLINRELGSWLFLSAIICDLPLAPDRRALDHCGRCTLCIDACPTGAITAPFQLDARRCLSYMTIENKNAIPVEYRPALGAHAYGCDICQDVCPWNRRSTVSDDPAWQPRVGLDSPRLLDLWQQHDDDLRRLLKGSPMKRAGVRRLRRNLAVSIGNSGDPEGAAALESSREESSRDPLVREHVEWALERLDGLTSEV